jgi:hypothetical protein
MESCDRLWKPSLASSDEEIDNLISGAIMKFEIKKPINLRFIGF